VPAKCTNRWVLLSYEQHIAPAAAAIPPCFFGTNLLQTLEAAAQTTVSWQLTRRECFCHCCLSCGIICVSSGARNIAPAVPAASFVVLTQRPLPFRNSRVCGTRSAESEPGDLGLSCSYCYISYRLANPIQMPAGPLWIFGSLPANGVCDSAIVLDMRHSWTQLFLSRLRKMFKT